MANISKINVKGTIYDIVDSSMNIKIGYRKSSTVVSLSPLTSADRSWATGIYSTLNCTGSTLSGFSDYKIAGVYAWNTTSSNCSFSRIESTGFNIVNNNPNYSVSSLYPTAGFLYIPSARFS